MPNGDIIFQSAASNCQISEEIRCMSSIGINDFPYTVLISDIIQLAF